MKLRFPSVSGAAVPDNAERGPSSNHDLPMLPACGRSQSAQIPGRLRVRQPSELRSEFRTWSTRSERQSLGRPDRGFCRRGRLQGRAPINTKDRRFAVSQLSVEFNTSGWRLFFCSSISLIFYRNQKFITVELKLHKHGSRIAMLR